MRARARVLVTSTSFGKTDSTPIRLLEENNCEVVWRKGPFADDELAALVHGFDAIIVGIDTVGRETVAAGDKLRVIVKHGTGVDNIDLGAAESAGIKIINAPHTNAVAVAEFVFATLLCLVRRLDDARSSLHEGRWEGSEFIGSELYGKTLGIIGMGHIGQWVAHIGKGFAMEVAYFDSQRNLNAEQELGAKLLSLSELLAQADVVSLHVPLILETRHLIGARELGMMKPTAYLVNAARGGVVDEDALYDALVGGKIRGAVLDVFPLEPPPSDWPMLRLKNVICTPHIAGYTIEANRRTSVVAAEALLKELSALEEDSD